MRQSEELTKQYGAESKDIANKYMETFGLEGGIIDPMSLTNAVGAFDASMESINSFLGRTLMTGSDIADLSFDLITEYSRITLTTELQ